MTSNVSSCSAELSDLRARISSYMVADAATGDYRLNREVYTNAALFELEMEQIFENNWVFVGHESQIAKPHDYLTTHVGRQPVILSRTATGEIACMLNTCAHRGAVVCRSKVGNRKTHSCGFHGWTYGSAGELRGIPGEEKGAYPPNLDKSKLGLKKVRAESYRGLIFASINPAVVSLSDYLGSSKHFIDLMLDASDSGRWEVLKGASTYRYKGNWKLSTENGLDGYHGPTVHGSYIATAMRRLKGMSSNQLKVMDLSRISDVGGGFVAFENGHGVLWTDYTNWKDRPSAESYDHYRETYGEAKADWMVKRIRNLLLAPNVFLMDSVSTQIRIVRPLAVDLTEVTIYVLAPVGESDASREKRLRQFEDFYNAAGLATPDDLAEFNYCQTGYGASGQPWSDISRGIPACNASDPGVVGNEFGGVLNGDTEPGNEGIYLAMYRDWSARLCSAIDRSLEKSA